MSTSGTLFCHWLHKLFFSIFLSSWLPLPATSSTFVVEYNNTHTVASESDWRRVISGTVPPFLVFQIPIQKSEMDDREYRIIQLSNGLQAIVVHDAGADEAAASLDVAGTKQFPSEFAYSEYLAKNNGAANAATSSSNTNYHFSVASHALSRTLERFAPFFHSPLFSPSSTSRELYAVDSEYKKNHQVDDRRVFQLDKHLSKKGHVWSKFGSGNMESLTNAAVISEASGLLMEGGISSRPPNFPQPPAPTCIAFYKPSITSREDEIKASGGATGRETRRRLVEWWNREYCASRMRLCIVGKESLDQLSELASTLFSPIPNRGQDSLPMVHDHPFGPNEKGTFVAVQTVMSTRRLEISFPMEYQAPHWRYKPSHFLSHFLGHQGPGSLSSYLTDKGWITNLRSGPQTPARGFTTYKIVLDLTKDGFQHYREVIIASFQYLALLRASKFDPCYQQEAAEISENRFRFNEKARAAEYAMSISQHMSWPIPKERSLSAPQVTWEWDSEDGEGQVKKYLESFRITEGRVMLLGTSAEHSKLALEAVWEKETWYGTMYHAERFTDEFIEQAQASNAIPELFLPGSNEFIPINFDVEKRSGMEPRKRPLLIRDTLWSNVWYKKDDRFFVPKGHVIIYLCSVAVNESPRAAVMTKLYSDIVNDSLHKSTYSASLAGIFYRFGLKGNSLYISFNGYNDKLVILIKRVLEVIKGLAVDTQRLAVMKEQNQKEWESFFLHHPYTLSDYFARYIMNAQQWTPVEKLKELTSITPEQIQGHMKQLLSHLHLRMLVSGNIYQDEALEIADIVEHSLGITANVLPIDQTLLLPEASNHTWICTIPNPSQVNSALTYYVHFGAIANQPLRVTASLLTQILCKPAFHVLRTQEQLGYFVKCSLFLLPGASEEGLRITVQSESPPGYLEQRVEVFLDGMKSAIETMTEEYFAEHKYGLEKKLLEKENNLARETSNFMEHIYAGHWDFLRKESDAGLLKTLTKNDVLQFFLSHVHPTSSTRSKLSVHVVSQKALPKRVSFAAFQAFRALLHEAKIDIHEIAWEECMGSDGNPLITNFIDYWREVFVTKGNLNGFLDAIPELVEKYPIDNGSSGRFCSGSSCIEGLKGFKAGLTPSVDLGPMAHWGDYLLSPHDDPPMRRAASTAVRSYVSRKG
ncbi:Metalloenzyme, LuxS/M16 peptidase-like protein [Lyophyllum atratum]|nr:Metalloenzyme, LuxS/M16 peptidase-like protein [Lyophyllum atratum]